MKKDLLLLILVCIYSCWLRAESPKQAQQLLNHKGWSFVENKGQLADEKGRLLTDIKYYGHQSGTNIYCMPGKLSFVFTQANKQGGNMSEATGLEDLLNDQPQKVDIKLNRVELVLVGSNPNAEIIASGQKEYYENYYLNNTNGILVHTFSTVTYKNIYPNIDMVVYAKGQGMKYEFVVRSGARVADIQLQWNGLDKMKMLENGGISYATRLGKMEESKPVSFTKNGNVVKSAFVQNNNKLSFSIGAYDKSQTLVIDPTISWATYFGGTSTDIVYGLTTDASGNLFTSGITLSTTGIATSGAYLTSYTSTSYNAFIAKFSASGSIGWSTYYSGSGGSVLTYGFSIAYDGSSSLYLSGYTGCTTGFATSGAFQSTHGGGTYDAYLAKFTTSGSLSWSTYMGGTGTDYSTCVTVDGSGNIYMTGRATSTTGIASSGAYQTSLAGATSYDAYLAKFNSSGSRIWSTYFGGTVLEYAINVAVDASGNPYIAGFTSSTTGVATSGAFHTSHGGGTYDLFLAKFTNGGSLSWATYFGGTGIEENGSVATDASGNVYLAGFTASTTGTGVATTGAYQTSFGGATYDICLAKFSSSGSLAWSTYFGGPSTDQSVLYTKGMAIDPSSGSVYITGQTASTSGIGTSGAYKSTHSGGTNDAFLAQFSPSGSLNMATYYGGTGDDFGQTITVDGSGNLYLGGYTTSGTSTGIATSGAYQTANGGGTDGFIVKFPSTVAKMNDAGLAGIASPASSFCSGTQAVKVKLRNYGRLELDSVYIGWSVNKKAQSPVYWTGKLLKDSVTTVNLGNFNFTALKDTIKIWTYKPNGVLVDSIPTNDTLSVVDTVNVPSATIGGGILICAGLDYLETVTVSNVYASENWMISYRKQGSTADSSMTGKGPGIFNLRTAVLNTTTGYTLTGITETSGTRMCSNKSMTTGITDTVKINPAPLAGFFGNDTTCNGTQGQLKFSISGVPNGEYWQATYRKQGSVMDSAIFGVGPGIFTLTTSNLDTKTAYSLNTLAVTTGSAQCFNFKLNSKDTVSINPIPMASISGGTSICAGDKASLVVNVSNVAAGQSWNVSYRKQGAAKDSILSGVGSGSFPLAISGLSATTGYTLTGISETSGHIQCSNSNLVSTDSIIVNPMPTAIITGGSAICAGKDASFKVVVSYVQPGQSWKLNYRKQGSTADSIMTGKGSGEFALRSTKLTTSTAYTLKSITETSGPLQCANNNLSASDTIKVNPYPVANPGSAKAVCLGGAATIGANAVNGNAYSWTSKPAGFTSATANPSFKPTATATYYLTETISATGCSKMDSVKVSVNAIPAASVGNDQTICAGKTATIGATAVNGNSYLWSSKPAGFTSLVANPSLNPKSSATYYLIETITATGCSKKDSVKISVNPAPLANTGGNKAICAGNTSTIGANAVSGNTYSWTTKPAGFTSSAASVTVNPKATTTYFLTETITATGCNKMDSSIITVNPMPVAHWSLNYSGIASVFHAADSSLADSSYHWSFGDGNTGTGHRINHTYTKAKAYQVSLRVNNTGGCNDRIDSSVNITMAGIAAAMPNISEIMVYPNPFQAATSLEYSLANAGKVTITLYNMDGRQIATLLSQDQMPGHYKFDINAEQYGLKTGTYMLKMMFDNQYISKLIMKL